MRQNVVPFQIWFKILVNFGFRFPKIFAKMMKKSQVAKMSPNLVTLNVT